MDDYDLRETIDLHPAVAECILRLTRERDAARAAIRDASRCDDCGAWATRYHSASARFGCDDCASGGGWTDDPHALALRAAMRAR